MVSQTHPARSTNPWLTIQEPCSELGFPLPFIFLGIFCWLRHSVDSFSRVKTNTANFFCMLPDGFGETLPEERRHGYLFPIPGGVIQHERSLVKDGLNALNRLAGSKFNDACQLFHRPATVVQAAAIDNVRKMVAEAGKCPDDLDGRKALQDMMKSHPLYGEPSTLASYSPEKLKILKSTSRPKSLKSLVPPNVLPLLNRCKSHIELSPSEVSAKFNADPLCCPKQPYWDPILKHSKSIRTQLIVDLWKVGVVDFRTSVKSHVGLFCVRKKDPAYIRLVVDCRIANAHHRAPPVTRLGSGANFCGLDLSPEMMEEHFSCAKAPLGWGSEMDVSDCFYQFALPECAKWFGINDPRSLDEWRKAGVSLSRVWDEDLGRWVEVTSNTELYPVVNAMPMGWTWALFLANETVAHITSMSSPQSCPEIREKLRVPQLWDGKTLSSVYVDNVAIFGAKYQDVADRIQTVSKAFEDLGIPVTWTYPHPVTEVETVGVIVDFKQKVVRNKPSRLWKVHLAGRELCRRSKVRAETVEVWLGHATSAMRMCPCLLSIFNFIYRFVMVNRGKRIKMWPSVRGEIMQACAMIWFARSNIGGSYCQQVDMGDSSSFGYAMTSRVVSHKLIQEACSVREKWRFIPLPEEVKSAIEWFSDPGKSEDDHVQEEQLRAFVRSGVGMNTEYGRWLQQALDEGSWLRTSPILSQYRAKKSRRIDIEVPELVKPVSNAILVPGSFSLLWMRKWRNTLEAINIKEGRVCLSSLKRSARSAAHVGTRKLTLCDNLSTVLALEKGRSSSVPMNRICKTACAIQTALQIKWHVRHVETKRNQADKPSRGIRMRQPPNVNHATVPQQECDSPGMPSRPKCPVPIQLASVVPPPGLGDRIHGQTCTCGSEKSLGRHVCSATDDYGHGRVQSRTKKKRKPNLKGCWELFCGSEELTKEIRQYGLCSFEGIDVKKGHKYDLTRKRVQDKVIEMLLTGQVGYVHMGTPCTVFSRARRGFTNHQKARHKECIGCELAFFSAEIARLCSKLNIFWSIENPRSSRLWEFPAIEELHSLGEVQFVEFTMCGYGQPYKKPTRLMTNCPELAQLSRRCTHGRHEVVLKGQSYDTVKGWVNRTTEAGAYPQPLCAKWAQAVKTALVHAEKVDSPIDRQEFHRQFTCQDCRPSDQKRETKPFDSKCPQILDSITFGQHSKVEVERRRRIRLRQREVAKKRPDKFSSKGNRAA